jgi:hypothetical protein
VIALSSESLEYWHDSFQYEWCDWGSSFRKLSTHEQKKKKNRLKHDLAHVNRNQTPWIISIWHSPWYCSNKGA